MAIEVTFFSRILAISACISVDSGVVSLLTMVSPAMWRSAVEVNPVTSPS